MNIFKNLKVIELASVLAGPSVGQFFAECGAEVIKIENPLTNGDVTRSWKLPTENTDSSVSTYFSAVNWGKKSILLNLKLHSDKEKLYYLIKEADIVLSSYKKGDDVKMGVDYPTLRKINPKIISGNITGYGNDSKRVGYDALLQAETGFVDMNGEENATLNGIKMPVALIDVLAAHQLKEGILIALLEREKTKIGKKVSVSLYETALASLANQATNWLNANHKPQRLGSEHPNIFPYGTIFNTQTGTIMLVVGNDKQFANLCEILGISEIVLDERFSNNANRVVNREILRPILIKAFSEVKREEILEKLEAANVPAGSVNNVSEALSKDSAQPLILRDNKSNLRGVRTFVAQFDDLPHQLNLTSPPEIGN